MNTLQPWQLAAPAGDGDVLLWPDPARWCELAEQAAGRLNVETTAMLLDMPLSDARRWARGQVKCFAGPVPDPDALWIVTGHQTYPYHAGIWAKNVAIDRAARRCGGAAVNLNVDHDRPHAGFQIAWPALDETGRLVRHGDLALEGDRPFERQPAPSPQGVSQLCRRIEAELNPLLTEPRNCPLDLSPQNGNFGHWFAGARAALDTHLGLRLAEAMTGQMADSDSFWLFVADLAVRPAKLHADYNAAVALSREQTGHDPAPDLRVEGDRFEMPLWTLRPDRPGRRRLFVAAHGGEIAFSDEADEIARLAADDLRLAATAVPALRAAFASAGDVQLRPRALTLTLFARLLLADLFVHGVGGAIYDVATDMLFQRLYGLAAPPYAVATATLHLPLDASTATAEQLRQARRLLRDMQFNPQRHLPPGLREIEPAASLLAARQSAVERNQALRDVADSLPPEQRQLQRRRQFDRIRQINRDLAGLLDAQLVEQHKRVRQLSQQRLTGEVALARDYFYGLFPTSKLQRLGESIGRLIGGPGATAIPRPAGLEAG